MKLIVGLGNPGEQYAHTRHNIGFMVLDQLADTLGARWQTESKYKAEIATIGQGDSKIILVKPQTYMNASGEAAQAVATFYKIPNDQIWAVYDDVDTPFGRLRVRRGGSGGGHQGVNSLIRHLGDNFLRLKCGISLNDRTKEPSEVYVLKPFNADERPHLPQVIQGVTDVITQHLANEPEATTYQLLD